MAEASIRISARDNYSSAINTMRNSTRHFANDANGLQEKLNELSRMKATIQLDVREAAKNLRNLEREYEQLKNSSNTSSETLEAAAERVRTASSEYDGMRRNLNLVNNEIRSTERSFASLERTQSRSANATATQNRNTNISAIKDFVTKMGKEQFGQVAQQEESLPLYKEEKWNFTEDKPIFKNGEPVIVTGNEAVKVWIWNALKTERKRYVVYTHNYGNDIEELIGQPYSEAVKSIEAGRYIEDCLLINPYITAVNDIETVFENEHLKISFTAETIYGSVEMRGDSFV